jgi:hypothetical protein
MEQQTQATSPVAPLQRNSINRYLTTISSSLLAGGAIYNLSGSAPTNEAWIFRDDVGAPHGIKGYEEQVNSVGMHHGHNHFPSEITWNTFNSAT